MTKYNSRMEINQNAARMDIDDKRGESHRTVADPTAAREFAAMSLWTAETRKMPVGTASDMGVLALTLVHHMLKPVKNLSRTNKTLAQEFLIKLFTQLPVPDAKTLSQTVSDLASLTPGFRRLLESRPGQQGLRLNSQYFGASVAAFQSGYDGHWITREAALRLRLIRFYEKTSGEFAKTVAKAFASLVKLGPAYAAWTAGWPVFVCDLNNTYHRYAAQEIDKAAKGDLVVVTHPMTVHTQTVVRRYAPDLTVVTDVDAFFATFLGDYGPAMLLERRIGGWTVTFPAGGAAERELKNKKYPGFARALARCAQMPPSLAEDSRAEAERTKPAAEGENA